MPVPKVIVVDNKDGTYSSELTTSVQVDELNNGRPTLIPTIVEGKKLPLKEAIRAAINSQLQYPSFNSNEEATAFAEQRTKQGGADILGFLGKDTKMPETNASYQALQQQMGDLSKPLQGGANQKAPLMESLIESVPLMFAGIADTMSGDNTTSQLVGGIMARRERQQQLARENELDLRKFQLMVGLKGFEAELAKLENDRKGLESTANIEQSRASAEASRAAASSYGAQTEETRAMLPFKTKKAQQELAIGEEGLAESRELRPLKTKRAQQELAIGDEQIAENKELRPLRKQKAQQELEIGTEQLAESRAFRPLREQKAQQELKAGDFEILSAKRMQPLREGKARQELEAGKLELSNARELQPLKKRRAEQELEAGELEISAQSFNQAKMLQEIEHRNARHTEIEKLMNSSDPALQKQGRYALLFEQPPKEQDDDGLGLVTKLFPSSKVYTNHPTDKGNQVLAAQSELIEKVGPAAPGSFTVLEAINDLNTAEKVSSEDKMRLYEYAMDELAPSMRLIQGDEVYQRNLNREVIMPLAKRVGKKPDQVWKDLIGSYNKKNSKDEQIKFLIKELPAVMANKPVENKPVVTKKKSVSTKETVPDSPLRKLHAILESEQDPKQLADYTTNYNKKKQSDTSRRSKQKQDEDEKERKRLEEYTKQYNAKRRALGLPVG